MIPEPNPKLKLQIFKKLYKSLKTPFPPINFLILGMLIGLEDRYINIKAAHAVDVAIRKFKKENPESDDQPVVKMKKTPTGFEMSIGDVDDD